VRVFAGLVAIAGLMVLGPADALADTLYVGKSGQGRGARVRTGDDGRVERFAIKWLADCRRPGLGFISGTQTTPKSPFEVHTRDQFVDVGGYRERLDGGKRAVYDARTVGNRVSERRWRGTFRIRVRLLRGSRLLDRCYLRTRWRVLART
jgi:hypothetical protein